MTHPALAVRPLRPVDLPAYLAFYRAGPDGQGVVGDTSGPPALRDLLSSVEPHRQVLVARCDGRIVGLLSVGSGPGLDTWTVDRLLCLPGDAAEETRRALLRHLCGLAGDDGIQKIFLRTLVDSPLVESAAHVGFTRYATEDLYRLPNVPRLRTAAPPGLRARRGRDHQPLFRLYCAAVPGTVRQAEGMTLQEWRWAEGWGLRRSLVRTPLSAVQRRDYVLVHEDQAVAWLVVERARRRIMVMTHPDVAVPIGALVRFGLTRLSPGRDTYCAVRDYQGALGPTLEFMGFRLVTSHTLLVRTLTVRVREPKLVPVRA